MFEDYWRLIWLIWPYLLGTLVLSLNLFARSIGARHPEIEIGAPVFRFRFQIPSPILLVFAFTLTGLLCLTIPMFRDYSRLYPTRLNMAVFFDEQGVASALRQINSSDLESLNVPQDWRKQRARYLRYLDSELMKTVHSTVPFRFAKEPESIHSSGYTTFEVEKCPDTWQTYRVKSAAGQLDHHCERPMKEPVEFRSEFQLLDTSNNWISLRVADLYLPRGWKKTLRPVFKQQFLDRYGRVRYHHTLQAVTVVRFLPVPSVGQTVYFYTVNGTGSQRQRVPIGYADYHSN